MDETLSGWWWLSFVDNGRPRGDRFLGVSIVPGAGLEGSVRSAWALDCNPGGEVKGAPIPCRLLPAAEWRERLLTKGEALELSAWMDGKRAD